MTDRAEAYRQFRGRDPDVAALLAKRGFPAEPAAGACPRAPRRKALLTGPPPCAVRRQMVIFFGSPFSNIKFTFRHGDGKPQVFLAVRDCGSG